MKFALASLFLAGAALAAPAPQNLELSTETVEVKELSIRYPYDTGVIESVWFKLSGDDATDIECSASNPGLAWEVFTCGETKYRFALGQGETETYALRIYHETGLAAGRSGSADIFTYCHAGGNNIQICSQQEAKQIVIKA